MSILKMEKPRHREAEKCVIVSQSKSGFRTGLVTVAPRKASSFSFLTSLYPDTEIKVFMNKIVPWKQSLSNL